MSPFGVLGTICSCFGVGRYWFRVSINPLEDILFLLLMSCFKKKWWSLNSFITLGASVTPPEQWIPKSMDNSKRRNFSLTGVFV